MSWPFMSRAASHTGAFNRAMHHIRCGIDGEPAARKLTVEVLDRGPGLDGDQPSRLFEPFVRGVQATGSGSGLGLATVASAVRAQGGTFGAENRDSGGARFWFTIPDVSSVPPTPAVVAEA